jgi:hypothetical protein
MCAQAGLSFFDARLSLTSKRERKIKLANQLAQGQGELTVDQTRPQAPWLLSTDADSGQGLRADRTGQYRNGCEAAFPVDWPRHALSRHPLAAVRPMPDPSPLWNAGAANKQTGAVRQINRPEGGSQMNSDSDLTYEEVREIAAGMLDKLERNLTNWLYHRLQRRKGRPPSQTDGREDSSPSAHYWKGKEMDQ